MVHMCSHEQLSILIGEDFNISRNPSEKNNDNFDHQWHFLFNSMIDELNLQELEMLGRTFTWANTLTNPRFEKLDRILMLTEWEQNFPLANVMPYVEAYQITRLCFLILVVHHQVAANPYSRLSWDGYYRMDLATW
jgi:hypothetical protein